MRSTQSNKPEKKPVTAYVLCDHLMEDFMSEDFASYSGVSWEVQQVTYGLVLVSNG